MASWKEHSDEHKNKYVWKVNTALKKSEMNSTEHESECINFTVGVRLKHQSACDGKNNRNILNVSMKRFRGSQ